MKLVIFGVIAFVVGIGAGTGVGIVTAPKPSPIAAADSTHATQDSTAAHPSEAAVDAVPVAAGAALTPVTRADSSHEAGVIAPLAGAGEAARSSESVIGAPATPRPEDFRQVARILTSMKASDQAKIVGFLSDDLVEGIVRSLGPRQAAVLLSQIPAQRAATLSKRLLHPSNPEKP